MATKSPEIPDQDQGAFFEISEQHSGADPESHKVTQNLEPKPEGVYSEDKPPARITTLTAKEQAEIDESVHAAVQTANRHKGQLGKHSAMGLDGKYDVDAIRPGIVLPGFGIVRNGDEEAAREYAEELNRKAGL